MGSKSQSQKHTQKVRPPQLEPSRADAGSGVAANVTVNAQIIINTKTLMQFI